MDINKTIIVLLIILFAAGCGTSGGSVDKTGSLSAKTNKALEVYQEEGDPQEALKHMRKVNPEDMSAEDCAVFSSLLLAAGEFEEAQAVAKQTLEKDPDNVDSLFNLALLAQVQGDWDGYSLHLNKMHSVAPEDPRANSALGILALQKEEVDQAVDYFQTALLAGDNFLAYNGMGQISLQAKRYENAVEWFSKAIAMDEENSYAYGDRSKANKGLEKFISAEKDLNRAIELDPVYVWHYVDRGRLRYRHMHKEKGAVDDFTKALELDPENFFALAYRGQILEEWGQWEQAYEDLRKAVELKPDYYPVYPSYAFLCYFKGEYAAARNYFELVRKDYPAEYSFPVMIALSLKQEGKEREARNYLEANIKSIPCENPFYEVARYYINPSNDYPFSTMIQKIGGEAKRLRFLFYLAAQYELQNMEGLADTYYREIAESGVDGFPEIRIAQQIWARKSE